MRDPPLSNRLCESIRGAVDAQKTENRLRDVAHRIVETIDLPACRIEQAMPPLARKDLEDHFACGLCAWPILRTQWQTLDPGFLHSLPHFPLQQRLHQFDEVIQPQQ